MAEETDVEKKAATAVHPTSDPAAPGYEDVVISEAPAAGSGNLLKRSLQNRHMQMIAMGMLFSSWGNAVVAHNASLRRWRNRCWFLRQHWECFADWWTRFTGRFPIEQSKISIASANSLKLICYLIVGTMLMLTVQALGELAVLYPVNGAFFSYCVRFINPAW